MQFASEYTKIDSQEKYVYFEISKIISYSFSFQWEIGECVRACVCQSIHFCVDEKKKNKNKTGSIVNDAFVFQKILKCVDFMMLVMCAHKYRHESTKINMVGSRSWAQLNGICVCALCGFRRLFVVPFIYKTIYEYYYGWDAVAFPIYFIQFNQIWWTFFFVSLLLKIYLFRQVKS